jgi:ribosomal protein S18 acetylase RimI-like enzyme
MSRQVTELVRPDGRSLVRCAGGWTPDAAAEAAALADRRGALAVAHVDEREAHQLDVLARAGFVVARRDAHVVIEIERALSAFREASLPDGVSITSAADVDETELRLLDDELREDVPGTSGWRSSPEEFREHTFADPAFDPRTYLVAVDSRTDELLGLVRIWMNPAGPRLGMIAVNVGHRRRGIASALLVQVLQTVRATGATEVTTEHDLTNVGSRALFERTGGRTIRTVLELVYEPRVREASGVG